MNENILIVDDEKEIADLIEVYIKQAERARKDNAQVQQQERTRKN